jgi:hypothetical protein
MKLTGEISARQAKLSVLFVALGIVLITPVLGFLTLIENHGFVDTGELASQMQGLVDRILIDSSALFAKPDHHLGEGVLSAFFLSGIGFVSLTFGVMLAWMRRELRHESVRFFLLVFLGMGFLTADALLGIHETVGHYMVFLTDLPYFDRPHDLIVVLYAIPAILFLAKFRKTILASRGALVLLDTAVAFFMVSAVSQVFKHPVEQVSELLFWMCTIAAVMKLGLRHLAVALDGRFATPSSDRTCVPATPSLPQQGVGGKGRERSEADTPVLVGAGAESGAE